jgi:hypothetical protein
MRAQSIITAHPIVNDNVTGRPKSHAGPPRARLSDAARRLVCRPFHQVIVLLDHHALLVTAVEAVFAEPALQRAEHIQPAGRQPLPGVEQPGLDAVVGLGEEKAEVDVVLQQRRAVLLPAPACRRTDGAPASTRRARIAAACTDGSAGPR